MPLVGRVAARDLPAGHVLTEDDVALKCPSGGLPPYELDRMMGRTLAHAVRADEALSWDTVGGLGGNGAGNYVATGRVSVK